MQKLHLKRDLITLAFFLYSLTHVSVCAQITCETIYPTTHLQRLKLPLAGEVWYYADDFTRQIHLSKGDHSFWKIIDYPTENNSKVTLAPMNLPVSQTTFKADNLLEFVWLFQDTVSRKNRIKILNERGDSIFFFPFNQTKITVNELLDRPTKLFFEKREADYAFSTTVFSLPDMVLEKTYMNASNFRRQIFGYAGEVYYFKNAPDNRLEIYYKNHSRWKSIPLAVPTNGGFTSDFDPYFFADDKIFNADTLIEVVFSYDMRGYDQVRIANENKKVLFHSNFFSSFQIDRQTGQPDKFFWNYQANNDAYPQYRVMSLPFPFIYPSTTPREKTYDMPIERIILSHFGAVYKYMLYSNSDTILLFDTNHRLIKNLPLKYSSNYSRHGLTPFISDNIVNSDNLIEVIWIEKNNATPSTNQLRITDERDNNIVSISEVNHFQVSQLVGLSNKLITKMKNSTTKVWRFTTSTAIQDPSVSNVLDVQISPNPFVTSFTIHNINSERPLSIRLFNAMGQLVFTEKNIQSNTTITPPHYLSKGIYLLDISIEERHITQRLVKL